ncbi:MAG: hypothetical protein QXD03_02225 [Candidatus Anstonellales archaeon]
MNQELILDSGKIRRKLKRKRIRSISKRFRIMECVYESKDLILLTSLSGLWKMKI